MQIQHQNSQSSTSASISCIKVDESFKSKLRGFPFCHLAFNPEESMDKLVAHCKQIFQAISFVTKFMGLYKEILEKKVKQLSSYLEQPSNMWQHQKTLFLDLDETLITRIAQPIPGSQIIMVGTQQIHFKVRPYAIEFMIQMQRYYDLVLFSASEECYSRTFFEYFNSRIGNGIKEYLCRDFCIQAYKNIYFKDLRIIQSRSLKDMILVDNSAFSFGSLIDNGVPVMTYDCSDNDRELQYLQGYLIAASKVEDVRIFNRERLRLRQMVNTINNSLSS